MRHENALNKGSLRRKGTKGIVLISALFSVLLLAGIAALLGAQAEANARVFARLEQVQYRALAEEAVQERLRAILGDLLTGAPPPAPSMNLAGRPFTLPQSGLEITVTLTGTAGLIDPYLAPPDLLALLDVIAPIDPEARAAMLATLPQGERYPSPSATLAHLGLNAEARRKLAPYLVLRSDGWLLHQAHVPDALRAGLDRLPPSAFAAAPSPRVLIRLSAP